MSLPYAAVVSALRSAANEAGRLRVDCLAEALRKSKPMKVAEAAQTFTQLVTGSSLDPVATRAGRAQINTMSPSARSVALLLALVLAVEGPLIARALLGVAAACGAAIGAVVPISVAVDATLLEAVAARRGAPIASRRRRAASAPRKLARRVAYGAPRSAH